MDRLKPICDRAAGLAPRDPVPLLFLAEALLLRHDGASARDVMRSAESRLDDKPASSTYWSTLAGLYERASLPTRADAAEAHAHHDSRSGIPPRTLRLATLRRMFGLPAATASGALPLDGEADYIEAATSIRTLEQSGHRDEAATALARFTEKYPSLPGPTILACEHEGHGGAPKARRLCQRAIAQKPDAVLALYVLASLDEQAGKTGPAIARLVHLLEVDPNLAEVWLLLGRLYGKTHQAGKLAELRGWYQDRFKAQIP
jgi:predicted Zn-dependent protease